MTCNWPGAFLSVMGRVPRLQAPPRGVCLRSRWRTLGLSRMSLGHFCCSRVRPPQSSPVGFHTDLRVCFPGVSNCSVVAKSCVRRVLDSGETARLLYRAGVLFCVSRRRPRRFAFAPAASNSLRLLVVSVCLRLPVVWIVPSDEQEFLILMKSTSRFYCKKSLPN